MEFCVQSNNGKVGKFIVPGIAGVYAGVWNEIDKRIEVPCAYTIRQMIPFRYRKAFDRAGGSFWFDSTSRWNGYKITGEIPHKSLYDRRGKYLCTLYAFAVPIAKESR